jgi:cephalosporin-C deacetylase
MPFFDKPLHELQTYLPPRTEPVDFDAFWSATLNEARSYPLNPRFERVDTGLDLIEVYDVTFNGYGGQPIKGWLRRPKHVTGNVPVMVEYVGYGGGRGLATDSLMWASVGVAHLVMDTRGQGSYWSRGDTPDPEPTDTNPHHPGFMTRGILNPYSYYYRRVFTDAVRAIEAAQHAPNVDASRIAVSGGSQGGGISIAAAALSSDVKLALPNVPFLCHYRHATQIVATHPYGEISRYLVVHRDKVEQVFATLAYFDGVNLGTRAKAKALFSVGLMDDICPPSTVYAAYNYYAGEKQMSVYEYNNHEGGGSDHNDPMIRFVREEFGM